MMRLQTQSRQYGSGRRVWGRRSVAAKEQNDIIHKIDTVNMLRRFTHHVSLVALLIGMGIPTLVKAQGMGIAAGANFNKLGDVETSDRRATLDNATGWHVHLWFDLPIGPVALRPGLRYMDAGRLFDPDSDETEGFEPFTEDQVVSFLEVPVDVRFRMSLPLVTPYFMAGPVLRFTTDPNNEDRLETFSLAAGAGVGLELGVVGLRFYPELKYTFGVTRFTKEEYQLGGVTVSPDEDQRLNAVMISIGIGL